MIEAVVKQYEMFVDRWDIVVLATQEHLFMVMLSMLFAVGISVPLGIILSRWSSFAEPIIGVAAVAQTIPSLALVGIIMMFVGIGKPPAIMALTIYAILPILRNTYTGIQGIDASAIEAGRGMGMTDLQILFKIQLPLALPVIMAGIRTATVITVGIATLATFIGAGGLGDPIMRGIDTRNNYLIFIGVIPAALLAIILDLFLKRIEYWATPKGIR